MTALALACYPSSDDLDRIPCIRTKDKMGLLTCVILEIYKSHIN